jgi:hypothetical protein
MARLSHPQSVTEPSALDGVDLAPPIPRVPVVIKTWRSLARFALDQRVARGHSAAIREQLARGTTSLDTVRRYEAAEQAARSAATGSPRAGASGDRRLSI